jgi:hypothetical protein
MQEVNLTSPFQAPYPPRAAKLQPLRLALASLRYAAKAICFSHRDVASPILFATPALRDSDSRCSQTRVVLTSTAGRTYGSGWFQWLGRSLTTHSKKAPLLGTD